MTVSGRLRASEKELDFDTPIREAPPEGRKPGPTAPGKLLRLLRLHWLPLRSIGRCLK